MADRSKIVESLTEGRTLSVSDFELVQHFADLIAQAETARRVIDQGGMTIFSEKGEIVSPIVVAQEKISREIRGWIKDRPDLFNPGAGKQEVQKPRGRAAFKAVG